MQPQFRTSFVPKKPIESTGRRTTRRAPLGLFFLLTLLLFLAIVAVSAGLFLYQQFLETSIVRKSEELEKARASFEPALIEELTKIDSRIQIAGELLDEHKALTRFFTFLENNTLQNVQFRNFRYSVLPDGNVTISMDGRARSFAAVALQSDVFGQSAFIRSPLFEDLNVDQRGDVIFNVTAFVEPSLVSYEAAVSSGGGVLPEGEAPIDEFFAPDASVEFDEGATDAFLDETVNDTSAPDFSDDTF